MWTLQESNLRLWGANPVNYHCSKGPKRSESAVEQIGQDWELNPGRYLPKALCYRYTISAGMVPRLGVEPRLEDLQSTVLP